jgi:hypothetical protein
MFHLENLVRLVPFSTFSIIGIIILIRYDLWIELVEGYSIYFGLTPRKLVVYSILITFGIMGAGYSIWNFYEYFINFRQSQRIANETHQREKEALIAIFKSLNGKRWFDKTRWCSDEPLYTWKGVKLNPSTHRVNKLILPDNELEGNFTHFSLL